MQISRTVLPRQDARSPFTHSRLNIFPIFQTYFDENQQLTVFDQNANFGYFKNFKVANVYADQFCIEVRGPLQ